MRKARGPQATHPPWGSLTRSHLDQPEIGDEDSLCASGAIPWREELGEHSLLRTQKV